MTPAPELMTVDDYFTRTETTSKPMELIYGAVRVAESPLPRHQSAVETVNLRSVGTIQLSDRERRP